MGISKESRDQLIAELVMMKLKMLRRKGRAPNVVRFFKIYHISHFSYALGTRTTL